MPVFQAIFAGAGVFAVARIAHVILDGRVALLAALLVAAHPALVYYDVKNLHPLGFDSAVLIWAMELVLMMRSSDSRRLALLAGCMLGVAILQRGSPATLAVLVPLWVARFGVGSIRPRISCWLLGVALLVTPVLARSVVIHGRPVFSTVTGEHLWIGNAPGSFGSALLPSGSSVISTAPSELATGSSELERNRLLTAAAWEIIGADPIAFVARSSRKFFYFWTFAPQTGATYPVVYKKIYLLYYAAIIGLAAVGLWRWRGARDLTPALVLIGGLFLVVSMTHAVFYFEMRHRWALEPLILIFSAAGLIGPPRSPEREGDS